MTADCLPSGSSGLSFLKARENLPSPGNYAFCKGAVCLLSWWQPLEPALHEALRKCLGVHCRLSGPSSPFRASFSCTLKSSTCKVTFKWQVRTCRSSVGDCHSLRPGPATVRGLHVRGPSGWHRAPQMRPTSAANTPWRTPGLYLSAGSLTPKACLHY